MARLNVGLVGLHQKEKLKRSSATKYVNTFDAAVQKLGHDAVYHLWQGLEPVYPIERVSFLVAFTLLFEMAVTGIWLKSECSEDNGGSEQAENPSRKTRQGERRTPSSCKSEKGQAARR